MDGHIKNLIDAIRELEDQLEAELSARQADLKYRIEGHRVVFEDAIARHHAEIKTKLLRYVLETKLSFFLTAPFIYALIVPLVLLDLLASLYQAVCFPVYKIEKVRRCDYLVFDRHNLRYLNAIEKLNCAYCSYANGLIAYLREIASRTEQYWCPIKHARRIVGAHNRYSRFVDFGDADTYREQLENLRGELQHTEPKNGF